MFSRSISGKLSRLTLELSNRATHRSRSSSSIYCPSSGYGLLIGRFDCVGASSSSLSSMSIDSSEPPSESTLLSAVNTSVLTSLFLSGRHFRRRASACDGTGHPQQDPAAHSPDQTCCGRWQEVGRWVQVNVVRRQIEQLGTNGYLRADDRVSVSIVNNISARLSTCFSERD